MSDEDNLASRISDLAARLQSDPTDSDEIAPEIKAESVFGIRIGELGLLIPVDKPCEILDKVQVNAFPNIHPWISGFINLRGNLLPVFDLRFFVEGTGDKAKRRLFAIERGDKAVALWIDHFPEIKNLLAFKPLRKLPTLPELIKRHVTKAYTHEGQVWLDIRYEQLFKVLGRHDMHSGEEVVS